MTTFLIAGRGRDADPEKSHFLLVNRLSFETKSDALKSMISQS